MKAKTNLRAGAVTVYGTDWCGWTTKQRDYLDGKGIAYNYVNCEQDSCPASVTAFPTIDNNGTMLTGYNEI